MSDRILVIAAHPDDEVIGVGGTLSKLKASGCITGVCLMTTIREEWNSPEMKKMKIKEIYKANQILATDQLYLYDLPPGRIDTIPFEDIIKNVDEAINTFKPHKIFTHFRHDLNTDHQSVSQAVLLSARPSKNRGIREINFFNEFTSATRLNFGSIQFEANLLIDISGVHFDRKCEAFKAYDSQLQSQKHPRSTENFENNASYWGIPFGSDYMEAFQTVWRIS